MYARSSWEGLRRAGQHQSKYHQLDQYRHNGIDQWDVEIYGYKRRKFFQTILSDEATVIVPPCGKRAGRMRNVIRIFFALSRRDYGNIAQDFNLGKRTIILVA